MLSWLTIMASRPANALAFVNSRPFVTSNLIGATNLEQLQENIDSVNLTVSPELLLEIEQLHLQIPNPAV